MRFQLALAVVMSVLVLSCGGSKQGKIPVVLVQVDDDNTLPASEGEAAQDGAIEQRLELDARLAFDVIGRSLEGNDADLAVLAAAYAMKLGLKHNAIKITGALERGVHSEDPLLVALSWRWLLNTKSVKHAPGTPSDDPVVSLMRVLFGLSRGHDEGVDQSFFCPRSEGRPLKPSSEANLRASESVSQLHPFDNGVLALAVVFHESRRYQWAEKDGLGNVVYSCPRIRDELFAALQLPEELMLRVSRMPSEPVTFGRSKVLTRLENPMAGSPIVSLRGAALSGPNDLRIGALRAMTVVVKTPQIEDLGVSAAGLKSDDALLRLEAARTLLYLIAKTQQD